MPRMICRKTLYREIELRLSYAAIYLNALIIRGTKKAVFVDDFL
jgi:hypothetical protein